MAALFRFQGLGHGNIGHFSFQGLGHGNIGHTCMAEFHSWCIYSVGCFTRNINSTTSFKLRAIEMNMNN